MRKIEWVKKIWQLIPAVILLGGAAALLWAARMAAGFAEWYSNTIYPPLVAVVGGFYGLVPFSVVEVFLYAGVVFIVYLLIRDRKRPWKILLNYSLIAAALLFLYASCCGVNYYRVPFSTYYIQTEEKKLQERAEASGEQIQLPAVSLSGLCGWLTEEVNRAYEELQNHPGNFEEMQKKGIKAMEGLAEQYPSLAGHYPKPKPLMVSGILSIQQCSGVYSPFTIEANYNNDMVPYNIPHTICHEMSHLRGFMREDEANFIGYLACLQSEDADFRYSGYLMGWIYAGNALAKVNYKEYERLHGLLNREVVAELDENSEFWNRFEGEVAEVQEKVNDAYLKANGQHDGVLSYGRVVDLMLVDYALRSYCLYPSGENVRIMGKSG